MGVGAVAGVGCGVPAAQDDVPLKRQGGEALFADRDAGGVVAGVQRGLDTQSGTGRRGGDGLDDDVLAGQGASTPVASDVREQSVLDLVPLRGTGWEVAHGDLKAGLGGQGGQLALHTR